MPRLIISLLPLLAFLPLTAHSADTPLDSVRAFYTAPLADERDPALFTGPALATLERHFKLQETEKDGYGCLDFSFVFNGQDFDEAEVARTLKLATSGETADSATVTADFDNFGAHQQLVWTLVKVDRTWLVANVEDREEGWQLDGYCDTE